MDENYTPDLLTLSDDEGNEFVLEKLDEYEDNGVVYYAMQPKFDDPQEELDYDGSLVIMREVYEGEDSFLEEIEDEEEFGRISGIFINRLEELYDIEE